MATVAPPPSKRQRVDAVDRSRHPADLNTIPQDLGSIRVQYVDQSTGAAAGPPVAIPVQNATTKNLETLLNTLQQNVSMVASLSHDGLGSSYMSDFH